ncbi:MAG: methionine--tRNA ligase [Thermaerobacter sp.]|nr:methionine--tRNA ligase [Thermaerobacter sp.]
MAERFTVTTPIYYPNDRLHIGHAYTTVAADALARYHRLREEEVFFVTGTDEHGQKIEERAQKAGTTPIAYVDEIVSDIRDLWQLLQISYDDFIRTTEPRHERVVQEIFRKLEASGDIYLSQYEGWYCTPCESFWVEGKLVDGNCPSCGGPVARLNEESYFFRLSRYAEPLLQHIDSHPDFIQPTSRRNEMISFIRQGLEDISVSRTSFRWGIPLPQDPRHIAYVWIDALTNYITACGYLQDEQRFARFWPADVHLVGKEIVRFHAIIWPAILLALGLPLPRVVYGHGWLLLGEQKMSKSRGNVIDPRQLVQRYGRDAVRYYLLREVPFGADGNYTEEALILRTNVDLANDLGNLLSRTTAMIERFTGGIVPKPSGDSVLRPVAVEAVRKATQSLDRLQVSDAVVAVFELVRRANKYIEEAAPWQLNRSGDARLNDVLYDLAESLRITAVVLKPFLVDAPHAIYRQLGLDSADAARLRDTAWGGLPPGTRVQRGEPIFPRIDAESIVASSAPADAAPETPQISIDDFSRLDLRVGTILSASKVKGADRLLELTVDLGEGEPRTVVSGIAEHYQPQALLGSQVVIVANLQPAKIRGIVSHGMILAGKTESGLQIVSPREALPPGTKIK